MPNDEKPVEPLPVEASTAVVTAEGEGRNKNLKEPEKRGDKKVKIPAGVAMNAAPEEPKPAAPKGSRITFDMYAQARSIPLQRREGMRAFTTVKEATLEEWTAIFRKY